MDFNAPEGEGGPCQRWRYGESIFRGPDDDAVFDRRRYAVDVLEEGRARAFVEEHHYSRSYPAAVFRVGLFGTGAQLEGVCVFSVPMNQRVVPAYTGLPAQEGLELGRFVLLDRCPRNSETFFLGVAFKLLRTHRPQMRAVVSYSDPVGRRAADGSVLTPGHVGIIYQAHNARYVGRGSARTLYVAPDGRVVSPRALSKIRLCECGWEAAQKRLEAMGAPSRRFAEAGADWVARALASDGFRAIAHPGNHCYAWPLATGTRRKQLETRFKESLPYPKQPDSPER